MKLFKKNIHLGNKNKNIKKMFERKTYYLKVETQNSCLNL